MLQRYCKSLVYQWILENVDKHGWTDITPSPFLCRKISQFDSIFAVWNFYADRTWNKSNIEIKVPFTYQTDCFAKLRHQWESAYSLAAWLLSYNNGLYRRDTLCWWYKIHHLQMTLLMCQLLDCKNTKNNRKNDEIINYLTRKMKI